MRRLSARLALWLSLLAVAAIAQGQSGNPWRQSNPNGPIGTGVRQDPGGRQGPVPGQFQPGSHARQPSAAGPSAGAYQPTRPDQPVQPRHPSLHRRPQGATDQQRAATEQRAASKQRAPFQLDARQQAQVDWVLKHWEERSSKTDTFRCDFTRYEYDPEAPRPAGTDPNSPVHQDRGEIRYESPDRGLFSVEQPETRQERWVCDGESVFEYKFDMKKLVEYPLPPELQGKAIANGPLPFIFQAEADSLKRRYWLRLTTPPGTREQIWIEAFPKHQQDRANFRRAELILDARRMQPQALQITLPQGNVRHSYVFTNIKVNDPLGFLHGNPFSATTPIGWKKVVERSEPARMSQGGSDARR